MQLAIFYSFLSSHVVSVPTEECMHIHYHLVWHPRVTAAWTMSGGPLHLLSKPDFPPLLGIVERKVDPQTKCKCGGHESIQSMPTALKELSYLA